MLVWSCSKGDSDEEGAGKQGGAAGDDEPPSDDESSEDDDGASEEDDEVSEDDEASGEEEPSKPRWGQDGEGAAQLDVDGRPAVLPRGLPPHPEDPRGVGCC